MFQTCHNANIMTLNMWWDYLQNGCHIGTDNNPALLGKCRSSVRTELVASALKKKRKRKAFWARDKTVLPFALLAPVAAHSETAAGLCGWGKKTAQVWHCSGTCVVPAHRRAVPRVKASPSQVHPAHQCFQVKQQLPRGSSAPFICDLMVKWAHPISFKVLPFQSSVMLPFPLSLILCILAYICLTCLSDIFPSLTFKLCLLFIFLSLFFLLLVTICICCLVYVTSDLLWGFPWLSFLLLLSPLLSLLPSVLSNLHTILLMCF